MKSKYSFNLWLFLTFIVMSQAIQAKEPATSGDKNTTENSSGIYRNVNEDGVVEFSDQSISNSEKVKLKSTNTFKAAKKKPTPQKVTREQAEIPQAGNTTNYIELSITSPKADQEIRSNDGLMTVSISIDPALNVANGDQIELYLDGRSQGKQKSSVFNLKEVYRGQHRLQAKVIDKSGTVLITSKNVQFTIQKFSALFKPKAKPKR